MILGVDFDGTIVDHCYPVIGPPVPGALEWLKILQDKNCKIILWTMRSGDELTHAVNYLNDNGIDLFGVNENPEQDWSESPKAYCHHYIDDAAIGCPLIRIEGFARICVDWTDVGQEILRKITPNR